MSERIIRLPGGRTIFYDRLTEAERPAVDDQLKAFFELVAHNPIQGFDWHSEAQRTALASRTPVTAVFAGNQFGKTTTAVVKALVECLQPDALPQRLRDFKRFHPMPSEPVQGWFLCPTEDKIFDSIKPAIEKWCAPSLLLGGSWGKAFHGERMQLRFANGSNISFKTYKQDASTLGGATLHFVIYDEPPPREHREECITRLLRHSGFEFFAMTPLKTNTGWIRREIFKNRESPDITVVRGTMHDNPTLDKGAVERILATYHNDLWRRAREFGDFVDVGGQIYSDAERCVIDPPSLDYYGDDRLATWDVVVGIDPGIRNAGIVFGAFDDENVCTVFDELLLQDKTVEDYANAIFAVLAKWGIPRTGRHAPLYVIDPAAKSRSQVNGQNVQTALAVLGIGAVPGMNAVEAGIQQVRGRFQHRRLLISSDCAGLRDELDEYAAEDRPDGEFKPIKQNDHRVDALRYLCCARMWYPSDELAAPSRTLGRRLPQGVALPAHMLHVASESPPMGRMS